MSEQPKCPSCGTEQVTGDQFCPECGAAIETPPAFDAAEWAAQRAQEPAAPETPRASASSPGLTPKPTRERAETSETRACPWCGETILAVAKKCKHCGEFLDPNSDALESAPPAAPSVEPRYRYIPTWGWKCLAHNKLICRPCWTEFGRPPKKPRMGEPKLYPHQLSEQQKASYSGTPGTRQRLSTVGRQGATGLACPKCGGTQFTAKRSMKGKVVGFSTLGVGGLLAPKSMVKCVACGTMFRRG
jgi:predicted RNA-binding Zn-ribbon protein involved in translation (DUF1610 family)